MPGLEPVERIPQVRKRRGTRAINPDAVPLWARKLAADVCREYEVPIPPIRWRRSGKHTLSSGVCNKERIAITAGSNIVDRRLVLLHELGHWLMHHRHGRPRESHGYRFWQQAWELYQLWEMDLEYAYAREGSYREKAKWTAPEAAHRGG